MDLSPLSPLGNSKKSNSASPPLVPTPPAEVFVRTMQTDIASLKASGGFRPKAERIIMSGGDEKKSSSLAIVIPKNRESILIFTIGATAVIFFGIIAYFLSKASLSIWLGLGKSENNVVTSTPALPITASVASGTNGASQPSAIEGDLSKGIWRKPFERTVTFAALVSADDVFDLKTPVQRLKDALSALRSTSTLVGIIPTDMEGEPITLVIMMNLIDASVLNPLFFSAHFEDRFGMFVYRDKFGSWPGYVLELKPGENWLFLKDDVKSIENSTKISNLFLSSPGSRDYGFEDVEIGGFSARSLGWKGFDPKNPSSKTQAQFVYGWFRGYLVLSTSKEGLEAVLPRL